jgi:hypothetical protein
MSGTPCRFFRSLTADAYQADVLSAVFPLFSSELAHVVGFRPPYDHTLRVRSPQPVGH